MSGSGMPKEAKVYGYPIGRATSRRRHAASVIASPALRTSRPRCSLSDRRPVLGMHNVEGCAGLPAQSLKHGGRA